MAKRIFLILLIIILVCISWFTHLKAQDLSKLSDEEKAVLIGKFSREKTPTPEVTEVYHSAPIFDSAADSLTALPEPVQTSKTPLEQEEPAADSLTAFEDLKPFGLELFAGPREAAPPNDIASASDYILGPGDNVNISLWGQVESEYVLTIDREGKVFIPKLGEVVAWGQTLSAFREHVQREMSAIYSDFGMSVALGKIRSIRVYLTGEVNYPGAYTVSSLTSLFNALYLAGGPNSHGSMRQIRLMRNGRQVAEVDLYKFLLQGDNSADARLESGDAIFVPISGPRVAIRGKVRREAVYELRGDESAFDLLRLAGGAAADAYLERVMLERVSGQDDWELVDVNLTNDNPVDTCSALLEDGDRLTVYSIFEMKRNMVAVFGQVRHPGYFERTDTTRLSGLIDRAKLQPYDVYLERANLFRKHDDMRREVIPVDLNGVLAGGAADSLTLQDGDSLHVYAITNVTWDKYVYIEGNVKRPGRYQLYENMTVEDLVFLAGSLKRGASLVRAEIAHIDSVGDVRLTAVDLTDRASRSITLNEDDRVYVRRLPNWQLHRTVRIEGEVMYPGEYVLTSREETLYSLLQRAGGLTELAFPRGTVFERTSVGDNLDRMQIPKVMKRSSPLVQDTLGNLSRTVLFEYDGESMNRIVLDVDRMLASRGTCCDVMLEPGDRIYVPPTPSGISVLGAVGANGTLNFQDGKKVRYYVDRAGDFTSEADKKGLRLIRANGEVLSGGGTMKKHVELGDVIVVPTKIHKEKNLTKTVTTTLSAVTGVLTTVLLIDRL